MAAAFPHMVSQPPWDEVEVQLSIRTKHPSEYVHLRDPRPAGFEPAASAAGGIRGQIERQDSAVRYNRGVAYGLTSPTSKHRFWRARAGCLK